MKVSVKLICLIGLLFIINVALHRVNADIDGPCGNASPEDEAMKLVPCAASAKDEKAAVNSNCCAQIKKIGQNPSCLCAVLLSNTAKKFGAKPEVAMTIPKRCNFVNRPVGYKCGAYTLP